MKKEQKQKKKRINWKRTLKNNGYMLGLIIKACPGVPILALISTLLGAVNSFLLNTYLYQYALNALQEGKELKIVLITLGCMFGYSVLYMLFSSISDCYFQLKYPKRAKMAIITATQIPTPIATMAVSFSMNFLSSIETSISHVR